MLGGEGGVGISCEGWAVGLGMLVISLDFFSDLLGPADWLVAGEEP